MTVHPVKLRDDLAISHQETDGNGSVVVKDPASGRFFRFREIEGFILQRLDGATPLESIREQVHARFGGAPSLETLEQFTARLHQLGLCGASPAGSSATKEPRRILRGDAFYLRIHAFNPDRLLAWLVPKTGFLFSRGFLVLSGALVAAAFGITVGRQAEILWGFRGLLQLHSLALAWVVVIAVIVAHELAHGLACRHFGGSVQEMGFILIFLQPTFYCNVSDAWLFPEKSKRLWVAFAGAQCELLLWALATVTWRLTDPATWINYVALVIMATSGVKSLFNLNPLIKLDGYYMLSDWLGIPNLRTRAFQHLKKCMHSLRAADWTWFRTIGGREHSIYLVYGLLAWCYSTLLLYLVVTSLGGFLVRNLQLWGAFLLTLFLYGIFRIPLHNTFAPLFTSSNPFMKIISHRYFRRGIVALVALALILGRAELRIAGEFVVLPVRHAEVRAQVDGIIGEVHADEGDMIDAGKVIVSLSEREVRAERQKLAAELAEKQARLKLLKAGSRLEEIEMGRTLVAKATDRTKFAATQLEIDSKLVQEKLISQKQFEDTRELAVVRGHELEEANTRLKLLLSGSRQEDIEATEAEVARLEAHRAFLDEQLGLLQLSSPICGVITTHKLKDKLGQALKKGDLVAEVHDLSTIRVEIEIPEKEIADVKIGQPVRIKARAHPATTFEGQVLSIAPVALEPKDARGQRMIRVTSRLDNRDLLLKPAMSGNAKIHCGQTPLIQLVGRRLIRFIRVEFWSWW